MKLVVVAWIVVILSDDMDSKVVLISPVFSFLHYLILFRSLLHQFPIEAKSTETLNHLQIFSWRLKSLAINSEGKSFRWRVFKVLFDSLRYKVRISLKRNKNKQNFVYGHSFIYLFICFSLAFYSWKSERNREKIKIQRITSIFMVSLHRRIKPK